ncbi:MAG TPA: hypothetical protein VIU33_03835 [Nitrospiria bacterium]
MTFEERRKHSRRIIARGYGPSRRKKRPSLFFGLERRRQQRRIRDRRQVIRRTADRPEDYEA